MLANAKSEAVPNERLRGGRRLLATQLIFVTLAAATFALLPADKGPILLVSLGGASATDMVGADLRLLGAGRFPHSLVVTGKRPSFAEALFGHGVLILPALPMLCGSAGTLES